MLIVGCDFHPGFQQVAIFDKQRGEYQEKRLQHRAEAEQFYRTLAGPTARVGRRPAGTIPASKACWRPKGLDSANCH